MIVEICMMTMMLKIFDDDDDDDDDDYTYTEADTTARSTARSAVSGKR